jgi:hypothetical protein
MNALIGMEWECAGCGKVIPNPPPASAGLGRCECGGAYWRSPPLGKHGVCPTCGGPYVGALAQAQAAGGAGG